MLMEQVLVYIGVALLSMKLFEMLYFHISVHDDKHSKELELESSKGERSLYVFLGLVWPISLSASIICLVLRSLIKFFEKVLWR